MQNKKDVIPILEADLVKYCEQIGIMEPPTLVFNMADFDRVAFDGKAQGGRKPLGQCSTHEKIILVNLEKKGKIWRSPTWNSKRRTYKKVVWGLREARYTLVHELVHYRWPSFAEGRRQHDRVKEIMSGRTFQARTNARVKQSPSLIIEINPRLGPWMESYLIVYR